ncbi:ANK_REP_REGION domain-containing protein [Apophysomyces ossiformis]|uniref:ANK_REP_REGION domain-containing protein n=1 Tax=Apophysomyces ossiformis TaxID=679940 RepID=A0A8H7BSW7_9FUNG|nr:ANK_REP_REGION domain-containing protein [Apophysomyces ossiformis]
MHHPQFQISNFALPLTPPMTPTSQPSEHDTACLSLKWKQSGMDQPLYKDTELNPNDVEQGLTLLSWACHSHSETYLKKYLQAYDLDINKTSGPANETALHIAASAGFIVGVKLLAQHPDIHINALNKYGQTALHLAAQTNHPRCIRALLAHGARPDLSDGRGQLALHVAVHRRHMHCVTELLQDPELLTVPSQIDKRDAIEMAVVVGDAPILRQLLSTIHERQQRRRQKSLLHLAVFYNRIECLQLLVDFGYDVNEDIVESPLYLAVQQRKFDLVRLLRKAGANPCLADGTNPSLGYAIHHGLLEMIPMLVTLSTSTEFIEQAISLADHLSRPQRNQTIDLIIRTLKAIAAKT